MKSFKILKPIDNTELDGFINEAHDKGRSEYNRLYIPNQGTDENGDMLHYFPYGSISILGQIAVDKKHIFLKNGYLQKPGIIVEKYYISKEIGGSFMGDEKYFRVIDSNIQEIERDNLVIVQAGQGHRFNIDKEEYFFVQPDKVLISLSKSGIIPGPHNMLLQAPPQEDLLLGLEEKSVNKGILNDKIYYFDDALYDITIKNKLHFVVAKKDIKVIERG